MQKKNGRISTQRRQRQRQAQKALLIAGTCMCGVIIALVILLHESRIEKSAAAVNVYTVTEEEPTVEKVLAAPRLKAMPVLGPQTVLVKELKPEPNLPRK